MANARVGLTGGRLLAWPPLEPLERQLIDLQVELTSSPNQLPTHKMIRNRERRRPAQSYRFSAALLAPPPSACLSARQAERNAARPFKCVHFQPAQASKRSAVRLAELIAMVASRRLATRAERSNKKARRRRQPKSSISRAPAAAKRAAAAAASRSQPDSAARENHLRAPLINGARRQAYEAAPQLLGWNNARQARDLDAWRTAGAWQEQAPARPADCTMLPGACSID